MAFDGSYHCDFLTPIDWALSLDSKAARSQGSSRGGKKQENKCVWCFFKLILTNNSWNIARLAASPFSTFLAKFNAK